MGNLPAVRRSLRRLPVHVRDGDQFTTTLPETGCVILQHPAGTDNSYLGCHDSLRIAGYWFSLSKAESKITSLGAKSRSLVKAQLSAAPWMRSMRPSSHSTESGPA